MDVKQKQRAVIEFLTKEGCTAVNIHRRLRNVFGEATIDESNVRRWVKKFKEGETRVQDKPRSGRPLTAATEENQNKVNDMIRADQCITVRKIVKELGCGHSAVEQIIHNLGYRKVGAKWIPRQWTADFEEKNLNMCPELLEAFEAHKDIFFS